MRVDAGTPFFINICAKAKPKPFSAQPLFGERVPQSSEFKKTGLILLP
jgi:hypothetical protein